LNYLKNLNNLAIAKISSNFVLEEYNSQYDGNQIMLFTFQQDTILSVDTTIIRNGEFFFRGKECLADFSIVTTGNYPDKVISSEVILNKGTIHVELDSINRVWGGELNDKLFVFQDSTRILFEKLKSLSENSSPNESIKIIDDLMKTYLYDFMIENQNNLLGMHTFKGYLGYFTLTDSVRFEILCDIFDKERKSDLVKSHLEYRDKYAQRLQDVGKKYEDFEFQSPEGDARKLSDYVGKLEYIYLDFWASWCGPCIADMPHLKEIYEKYKDKGFEIIGISLDTDRQSWINALNRIETPWTQLCDFEGAQSKVAEAYHIKGIPKGILLNKEGIIVETNLRGSTFLDKKIQELFD